MSFIDTPDLKTGFWIGLGVALALMFLGLVQILILKARRKNA